jgi:hypothetical protein
MTRILEEQIAQGRSTPGAKQANDTAIEMTKRKSKPGKK